MNQPHAPATLMVFLLTDLTDSTRWKQLLGDHIYAQNLLQPHNDLFRKLLSEFPRAVERNFTGDAFLITFSSPSAAVQFALWFHEAPATRDRSEAVTRTSRRPETRIGIHLGEAIAYADADPDIQQITGQAVDLAARLASRIG
jgi:class 3 adenylate cyclase